MSDNGWKKVSGGNSAEIWKFVNKDDEVSGVYVETHQTTNKFTNSPQNVYTFELADGTRRAVFAPVALDREMAKIKIGQEVRIVYLGKEKNPKTGFSYHNFDVFSRNPENTPAQESKGEEEVNPDDIPF